MPAITRGAAFATRRTTAPSDGTDPASSALEQLLHRYAAVLWHAVRQYECKLLRSPRESPYQMGPTNGHHITIVITINKRHVALTETVLA